MDGKITSLCLLIAIGYVAGEHYYYPDHEYEERICPQHVNSECGPLPNMYAGGFALSQTPYGQTAHLLCKDGYEPSENTTIYCGCDHQWSDSNCAYCKGELSGTCFVVVFPQATRKSKGNIVRRIYLTTDRPTEVTVYCPYLSLYSTYVFYSYDELTFPKTITLFNRNAINDKVVYIFSNESINVYAQVARRSRAQIGMDKWQVRPCHALSDTYWAVTNIATNQLAIASLITADVTTSCTIYDTTGNVWASITLPPERVWSYFSNPDYFEEDYTGFKIECDQLAVVVFSFYFANFPEKEDGSRDSGIDQAPPYNEFAKVCIAAPFIVGQFGIKLLSVDDDTKVYINDNGDNSFDWDFTLDSNEFEVIQVSDTAIVIVSTNPTLSYSLGPTSSFINDVMSDPCLLQCLDPKLWSNNYHVAMPEFGFDVVTIRIIIPANHADDIEINGFPVLPTFYRMTKVPNGISYKILYFVYEFPFSVLLNVHINSISGAMFNCDIFAIQRVGQICFSCGRNYKAN